MGEIADWHIDQMIDPWDDDPWEYDHSYGDKIHNNRLDKAFQDLLESDKMIEEDTSTTEFKAWPKIPRAKTNTITITEKMDGTNACINIHDGQIVSVQSRKRLITPEDDNYGFAGWVERNAEALVTLGNGRHYGEWAGLGIQKNPHQLSEKKLFLFNTYRPIETLPDCVEQVRVLYNGAYSDAIVDDAFMSLWNEHKDSPYHPEGIIIYYHLFRHRVKMTYGNVDGKWVEEHASS